MIQFTWHTKFFIWNFPSALTYAAQRTVIYTVAICILYPDSSHRQEYTRQRLTVVVFSHLHSRYNIESPKKNNTDVHIQSLFNTDFWIYISMYISNLYTYIYLSVYVCKTKQFDTAGVLAILSVICLISCHAVCFFIDSSTINCEKYNAFVCLEFTVSNFVTSRLCCSWNQNLHAACKPSIFLQLLSTNSVWHHQHWWHVQCDFTVKIVLYTIKGIPSPPFPPKSKEIKYLNSDYPGTLIQWKIWEDV